MANFMSFLGSNGEHRPSVSENCHQVGGQRKIDFKNKNRVWGCGLNSNGSGYSLVVVCCKQWTRLLSKVDYLYGAVSTAEVMWRQMRKRLLLSGRKRSWTILRYYYPSICQIELR